MNVIAVDANLLLDYFLGRTQAKRLIQLLTQVEQGEIVLYTPLPVVLECEWVLRSYYDLPKSRIIGYLHAIDALNTYGSESTDDLHRALTLWQTQTVSFDDCVIVILALRARATELATGDRKLTTLFRKLRNER